MAFPIFLESVKEGKNVLSLDLLSPVICGAIIIEYTLGFLLIINAKR